MQQYARDEDGDLWELDAQGNAVRMVQSASPSQGRVFTLPQNPKEARQEARQERNDDRADRREERAENTAERQAQNDAIANQLKQVELQLKKAELDKSGGGTQRAGALRSLVGQINRVQQLFNSGPGATTGVGAVKDYLPTGTNRAFDAAGAQLSQQGLAAFRVPGTGTVSDRDAIMFDKANLPQASNFDDATREQLRGLRARVEEEYRTLGVPAPKWQFLEDAAAGQAEQKADNEVPDPTTGADLKAPATDNSPDDLPPANDGGAPELPTGGKRIVEDARATARIESLINAGASMATVNAALKQMKAEPVGFGFWSALEKWRKANPGKRYTAATINEAQPLNTWEKVLANPYVAPVAAGAARYADAATAGLVGLMAGEDGRGTLQAAGELNPGFATGGDILGAITGSLGAGSAAVKTAAKIAPKVARAAPAIGDMTYGSLYGFNTAEEGEGLQNAVLGGAAGLGGNVLGSVIGKGISRIRAPQSSYLSGADKSILGTVKGEVDALRPQVTEAQNLDMPLALADTDPRLRSLAGSVSRKSVDARALAERALDPRARAQAERAFGAIDHHLAPSGNVDEIAAQALQQGRSASADLYAAAKAQPAPDLAYNPALADILQRPSSEAGLRRAYNIALDEGVSPADLSITLSMDGKPILQGNPTWQTLHYLRRGLDSEIESAIDPVTRAVKPGMGDAQGAMIGLRRDLDEQFGALNPTFKAADEKFAEFAQQGTAARQGYSATSSKVRPEVVEGVVQNMPEANLPFYQRGYASSLADAVEDARLSANPYERIYGTTGQQQKLASVFPEGAPTFDRIYNIEGQMGKTRQEVLGGSPTAGRLQADEQLNGGLGTSVLDAASQVLTGGGVSLGSMLNMGKRALGDSLKLGIGKQAVKRADELAPVLFGTNPQATEAYLNDLLARAAARAARSKTAGQIGGGFGAGVLTPLLVGQ